MFIPFNPTKHKDVPLFELQDEQQGDVIASKYVPSTATFEEAKACPWYYAVQSATKERKRKIRISYKGGAGSGNFGHAGRPGTVGGSSSIRIGIPSAGIGIHHVKSSDLKNYLPKTVAADVQSVASKLGQAEVKVHVVPEGFVVNSHGDGIVMSYNSLRKMSRTTEAVAAQRPKLPKKVSPESYQSMIDKVGRQNDVMIDETPGSMKTARAVAKVFREVASGAASGAVIGAVGGSGQGLADLIKTGKMDKFFQSKKVRDLANQVAKATGQTDSSIMGDIKKAAIRGAAMGGVLGAARAIQHIIERGSGQFKTQPRYILKQLRSSGRTSVGKESWAMLIRDLGNNQYDLDVYRSA